MKLSVSVPDDLWTSVATPDASPSQIIQDALRHVALSRATSESRIADVPQRVGKQLEHEGGDPLARLVSDAESIQGQGYGIGLEVGKELSWTQLEALPSGGELRSGIYAALDGNDLGPGLLEDLADRLWRAISDWDVELANDEYGEPVPSRLLCKGIADGIDDLRYAVLARLSQAPERAAVGSDKGAGQ